MLLRIQADLNNVLVWMVSTRFISKSSSPCINPLVNVASAPITIGITVTFLFYVFFQYSCKVLEFISLLTFFLFYPVISRNGNVHYSIWPIEKTLSSATTPDQSGPWSNGNKGVLRIPQASNITGTLPLDCLVSYPWNSLGSFTRCILQP